MFHGSFHTHRPITPYLDDCSYILSAESDSVNFTTLLLKIVLVILCLLPFFKSFESVS
jgi:hypothetical protein